MPALMRFKQVSQPSRWRVATAARSAFSPLIPARPRSIQAPYSKARLSSDCQAGSSALAAPIPPHAPALIWTLGLMNDSLAEAEPEAFDFVHLSNILDWLTPDEAATTLDRAWSALRTGGRVLIRHLNSTLDIPALGARFEWETKGAAVLHAADRSFFYRGLHLGRKR